MFSKKEEEKENTCICHNEYISKSIPRMSFILLLYIILYLYYTWYIIYNIYIHMLVLYIISILVYIAMDLLFH